jgi:chemotaxis protein MotB
MNWVKSLSLLFIMVLSGGCAHKYSEQEYRALETKLVQCEQESKRIAEENQKTKDQFDLLNKDAKKARDENETCQRDKQEFLDKNIDTLEQNKSLLQQISHFKAIMQERKDVQGRLTKVYDAAMTLLSQERLADQLYIIKANERVRIVIPQRVLFAGPRSAWLLPKGSKLVEKIAKGLKSMDLGYIEIGGHTDNAQLSESVRKNYANNWYLSDARAIAVLEVFETQGLMKDRLAAIAYADTRPIADNNSEEGMGMNRRVEITIMP